MTAGQICLGVSKKGLRRKFVWVILCVCGTTLLIFVIGFKGKDTNYLWRTPILRPPFGGKCFGWATTCPKRIDLLNHEALVCLTWSIFSQGAER